jgi:hypothetical protein
MTNSKLTKYLSEIERKKRAKIIQSKEEKIRR